MTERSRRRALAHHYQRRGWTAYGLREVVVERMLPDVMQIETTSYCNLRCVFCPYDEMTRPKTHMNVSLFKDFLDREAGHVRSLGLHHFGEPFLNPDLSSFVQECSSRAITTTVSSNCTTIKEEQAHAVIKAGLGRLIISLDATNAADYERLRVGGRYLNVREGIDIFLAAKRQLGASTYVQVQFICTPENSSTWFDFERQWRDVEGVDQVVFRDERTHAGQRIRHTDYRVREGARLPCRYLWESLVILVDGRVVPCCKDFDGKEVLGNVFDGSRLADIWNSSRMTELRRAHVEGRFSELNLCSSCGEWPGHRRMSVDESLAAYDAFRKAKDTSRQKPTHSRVFE